MVTALFTAGGSTYVQEGGGAGLEIIEITAAKKHAGLTKDASAEQIKKARAEPDAPPPRIKLLFTRTLLILSVKSRDMNLRPYRVYPRIMKKLLAVNLIQ